MVRSLRVFYWVVTERLIIRSGFLSGFNFIFFIFLFIFIFIVILKKFKTKTPETFRAASGISTYRSGKPPPGTATGGGVDQNWSGRSPERDARAHTRRLKLLRVGFTRRRFPGACGGFWVAASGVCFVLWRCTYIRLVLAGRALERAVVA